MDVTDYTHKIYAKETTKNYIKQNLILFLTKLAGVLAIERQFWGWFSISARGYQQQGLLDSGSDCKHRFSC